jgi:hypothetical protein
MSTETKWKGENIGPRQAKTFNQAVGRFQWEAKTITEITAHGTHDVTPMFTGPVNPQAAPLMAEIYARYNGTVTGSNYARIVADIEAAIVKLKESRPVRDVRPTAEEIAERNRINAEREEKARAEAAHLATLKRHEYGLAETSRAVKQVLSVLFPGTKFSVRSESYSGGCSIDASWTDGPTEKQVKPILDVFERAWFDGMEDLEHHIGPQEWRGHLFDFTGKYTKGSRSTSRALLEECAARFARETELPAPAIVETNGHPYIDRSGPACGFSFFTAQPDDYPEGVLCRDACAHWSAADIINQMTHYTSKEAATIPMVESWPEGEPEPDNSARAVVFRILLGELPEKPAAAQEAPARVSVSGVTVTENDEKDGIEVRFPAKPAPEVLERLKANGWRWSRFSSWYTRRTDAARKFAEALTA